LVDPGHREPAVAFDSPGKVSSDESRQTSGRCAQDHLVELLLAGERDDAFERIETADLAVSSGSSVTEASEVTLQDGVACGPRPAVIESVTGIGSERGFVEVRRARKEDHEMKPAGTASQTILEGSD
jgi:hypothetical protein